MSDQCKFCVVRGDIEKCKATDCSIHENWYSLEQKKSIESLEKRVKELDDRLLDLINRISEFLSNSGFGSADIMSNAITTRFIEMGGRHELTKTDNREGLV